jgi:hypothetical protein
VEVKKMRALKKLIGKEVAIRLSETQRQTQYNEEGDIVQDNEVASTLLGTLMDVDDRFIYIGRNDNMDVIINIDSILLMTADPDMIADWIGNEEDSLPIDKGSMN